MAGSANTAAQLRARCREAGIDPFWRNDGHKHALTKDEMMHVLRRTDLMKGGEKKWLRPGTYPPPVSRACHAFWVDPRVVEPNATRNVSELPGYGQLGIASACRAGLSVVLWTYGEVRNVPFGFGQLVVKDASTLLPLTHAVGYMQRGLRIQHLADWVRLLAIKQHHSDHRFALTLAGASERTCVPHKTLEFEKHGGCWFLVVLTLAISASEVRERCTYVCALVYARMRTCTRARAHPHTKSWLSWVG